MVFYCSELGIANLLRLIVLIKVFLHKKRLKTKKTLSGISRKYILKPVHNFMRMITTLRLIFNIPLFLDLDKESVCVYLSHTGRDLGQGVVCVCVCVCLCVCVCVSVCECVCICPVEIVILRNHIFFQDRTHKKGKSQ